MWYAATTVPVPDASPPLTLAAAKSRLRIDFGDDDTLLSDMIAEAVAHIERYCNIRLGRQVLTCRCDSFSDFARLPDGPLVADAVQSVAYVDPAGVAVSSIRPPTPCGLMGLKASSCRDPARRFRKAAPAS